MKLLKIIFSRFPIFFLGVLVQLALVFVMLAYYAQYFFWFEAVSLLLALAVFLHMLNRDTAAEFKLPWMFLLVVFPLFGTVLYLFFSRPRVRYRQSRALREMEERREEYLLSSPTYRASLVSTLSEYMGQERALAVTAYSHGYLGNAVAYYGEGEAFFTALYDEIARAEKFVFLEYFSIEHGELWQRLHALLCQKAKEGVEVRLLYDDLGTLGKLSWRYDKRLAEEGITARRFNPVRPILSGIFNYRDHRKIAVVDGRVGFVGGMNIGDEYAGLSRPYGVWKDAGIRIEGEAVGNLTFLFLQLFATAGAADSDCSAYFSPRPPVGCGEGYVHVFGAGPTPFYPDQVAEGVLLNLIASAKHTLFITTPYLIVDRTMQVALRHAALRGVDVRIVTPHIPDKRVVFQLTRASYRPLLASSVRIFEYTPGFLHAKQVLVDGRLALISSINLDYRSLSHHFECGALLYRTPAIADIARDFEELFSVSQEITREGFRMNPLGRLTASLLTLLSPLF